MSAQEPLLQTTLAELDVSYIEDVLRDLQARRAEHEQRRNWYGEHSPGSAEAFHDGRAAEAQWIMQRIRQAIEDAEAQEQRAQAEEVRL